MSLLAKYGPADVVRQALIGLSLGTDPSLGGSWPIFSPSEPDAPDNCITIRDTTGKDDGRDGPTGVRTEHYGFQVRVRSDDEWTGYRKAQAIAVGVSNVLRQEVTLTDETFRIQAITNVGPVLSLGKGRPPSKRHLHTLNALVSLRRIT